MGYLEKEAALKILTDLEGTEFVVRTKEDDEKLQSNILENGVSEKIGDRISEIHSQYDTDIFTITGLKKDPSQKTYEFNKQVLTTLTQDKERFTELQAKYTELEKTKGKGDTDLQAQLDQVKEQALLAQAESEKVISGLKNESSSQQKGFAIDGAIAGLKFNENIPESVRKSYIDKVRINLIENSEFGDNGLRFLKDGKPRMDEKFEVMGVTAVVGVELADILATDKSGLGLGKDKKDLVPMTVPEHVRDSNSLIAHMKTIPGLKMHSEEWDEMYKNLKKQLKF